MRVYILLCLAALVVLPLPATADPGHSHKHLNGKPRFSSGEPDDPRQEARIIRVAMRETDDGKMIYEPNRIHVKRGESIRFLLENAGTIPHEFMLATPAENQKHGAEMQETPNMKHDDPNGRTLESGKSSELLWRFTTPGTFEFACLIPGHVAAGMLGTVEVH
jgi:uncharacterized cupredoxin-like copper-binding protein